MRAIRVIPAALVAAGLLTLWYFRSFRWRLDLGWLRETWYLTWRYLVSGVFNTGSALATVLVVAALAGARALGSVRGAQLLTRPFMVVYVAATSAGVSELSRVPPASPDYARHVPRLLTRFTRYGNQRGAFSSERYWKHREYQAILGCLAVLAILIVKMLLACNIFTFFWPA